MIWYKVSDRHIDLLKLYIIKLTIFTVSLCGLNFGQNFSRLIFKQTRFGRFWRQRWYLGRLPLGIHAELQRHFGETNNFLNKSGFQSSGRSFFRMEMVMMNLMILRFIPAQKLLLTQTRSFSLSKWKAPGAEHLNCWNMMMIHQLSLWVKNDLSN